MSAPIPRFKPYYLTPQNDGEYVRYTDYATLEAQGKQLREALRTIATLEVSYNPWSECARIARAALAATNPEETK